MKLSLRANLWNLGGFIMKKKIVVIFGGICVVAISIFAYKKIYGNNSIDRVDQTETSKENIKDGTYATDILKNDKTGKVSKSDVVIAGDEVLVTEDELKSTKQFFEASGLSDAVAEKKAIDYVEKCDAMYIDAIKAGYSVTDKEVSDYVDELRKTAKTVDNKDDVQKIISKYPSEDDYWNYMKIVYEKQLPIQKYVESLENDFEKQNNMKKGSEEFETKFNERLNLIEKEAIKEQHYMDQITDDKLKTFKVE